MARKDQTATAGTAFTEGANTPGAPTFVSHTVDTITIDITENSNGDKVEYALYSNTHSKYIGTDGAPDEASEIWQTAAVWDDIAVTGLSTYTAYTFKVKARDEDEAETDFSDNSAIMACLPILDAGAMSENVEYEVTGGNTKVVNTDDDYPVISGNVATYDEDGNAESYYGDIVVTYKLQSYRSLTGNSISVEFSEDGETWAAATMGTGGDGLTGLTASKDGVSHTYSFDSYESCGKSESDETVYLRITPNDSDSASATVVTVSAFSVNNRAAAITWVRYQGDDTDYPFDKDTTPVLRAVMPYLRGGTIGLPEVGFYDAADGTTPVLEMKSYETVAGWKYEDSPGSWNDLTVAGIPAAAIDGVNQMEATVQAADALPTGNYIISGKMYEDRDRG